MKVSTERMPDAQVSLQIEVDEERLEKAKSSAYRKLAKNARIPGFRPGKAPRAIIERHLGEHAILHEAIELVVPQVYREALDQEEINPIDRAEYELVTEEPLVVKFTVPVRPTVDLGDYQSIRIPREPVIVDQEKVDEAIEVLRHRYATLEPVERPVQWGDIVRADVRATVDGSPILNEDDAEFALVEGREVSLPGFAQGLIGREKGTEFEVQVTVPDEIPDENLRGKQAIYTVNLKEVKQEVLPELNDDFAREVGEGFDSLDALRERVESDLRQTMEQEAEHQYHDAALDALVERATVEFPPVLLEREVDRLLEEQMGGVGQAGRTADGAREQLERYLQSVGKTEEDLRAELRPIAETRIRRALVLSELTEAEHIQVTDEEVDAEIEQVASSAGDRADEIRRLFGNPAAKENIRRSMVTRKTLERLVEIASADEAGTDGQAERTESTDE